MVPRPVLLAGDPRWRDRLLQLTTNIGVRVDVAIDVVGVRRYWERAPLILIGPDAVTDCLRFGLPVRPGLILVLDRPQGIGSRPGRRQWDMATRIGAEAVAILPLAAPWLARRLVESAAVCPPRAPVIAVVPGNGGAGASVLAVGLAVTAACHGMRPMLIDGDPLGGGLELMLGSWRQEPKPGHPLASVARAWYRYPAGSTWYAEPGELTFASWDRELTAIPVTGMRNALDMGRRSSGLVIVDLPRHVDGSTAFALETADRTLLAVSADVRACAAAARVAKSLEPHCREMELVVRGSVASRLRAGDMARMLQRPLAGTMRTESGLRAAVEKGNPPIRNGRGSLARTCRQLLAGIVTAAYLTPQPVAADESDQPEATAPTDTPAPEKGQHRPSTPTSEGTADA